MSPKAWPESGIWQFGTSPKNYFHPFTTFCEQEVFQDQTHRDKKLCISLHCAEPQRAEDIFCSLFAFISAVFRYRRGSIALDS